MEMHQVKYFLAVARHLNFTRAADELGVAQPSLTRAIQKLEAELLGPLFRRERANTHLTELGRMIMPHLETALAAAEAAKSQAVRLRAKDAGSLTLGLCSGIDGVGLTTRVLQVTRQLPNLNVQIDVDTAAAIEKRLMAGELDAAILVPGDTPNERFNLCLVREDDLVVVFANHHRFAGYSSMTLEALDGEPLVERFGCPFEDALTRIMNAQALTRIIKHRSNDPLWIAALVRDGLGCAVVPESLARANALSFRKLEGVSLRHRTMLATVAGRRHSVALGALIHAVASLATA